VGLSSSPGTASGARQFAGCGRRGGGRGACGGDRLAVEERPDPLAELDARTSTIDQLAARRGDVSRE
jgi:hypothetical protein